MSSYTLPKRRTIFPSRSLNNCPSGFSLPITHLSVVGTETVDGQFFHFRLSLVSDSAESIRIDMQPSYTDKSCLMRGVALVEYDPNTESPSLGLAPFNVTVSPNTTAAMLLHLIFDKHSMDQYIFNDEGQGCRHWCASVLDRLVEEGVVNSNDANSFENFEGEEHKKFGSKFPMPRIKGTFYSWFLYPSVAQT